MGGLIAKEFRVQNYRNIDDSGPIELDRVTAFVGRNESGKTALLKALHKFNPATPQPYVPQREFPRDRFTRDFRNGADWPVSTIKFEIVGELKNILAEIASTTPPAFVTVTRYYDGSLRYQFDPNLVEPVLDPAPVLSTIDKFSDSAMDLAAPAPEHEATYTAIRKELLGWVASAKERIVEHRDLRTDAGKAALRAINDDATKLGRPETKTLVKELVSELATPLKLSNEPPVVERAEKEVELELPVFIYFDNYGILDSAIHLPRLIEDLKIHPDDPKVRTVNAMFKHVGLTAQEVYELGQSKTAIGRIKGEAVGAEAIAQDQANTELRSIKLNSASNDITRRFTEWWKQRRHTIRYHADGEFFRIWIADDRRPDIEIELESRSQGFQWFFSFYLVFLVESNEMHKEAILLLDEPALHLHPTAQQELIAFLEALSEKNPLLYSTHSPFLIDGEHLQRVRPVTEDSTGHSHISSGTWPKDRETIFPLQAAAGYAMVRGLFAHKKNLLVEGMSENLYLHALSLICRHTKRTCLPDDTYITPAGGLPMVAKIAALFLGQEVRPVVLLDGDQASYVARTKLLQNLYSGHDNQIVMLDDVLKLPECEIEDMIGEATILPVLAEVVGKSIALEAADRTKSSLVKQIEAAALRLGIDLPDGWKPETARRIAVAWSMGDPLRVPVEILDRAAALFDEFNKRLALAKS